MTKTDRELTAKRGLRLVGGSRALADRRASDRANTKKGASDWNPEAAKEVGRGTAQHSE